MVEEPADAKEKKTANGYGDNIYWKLIIYDKYDDSLDADEQDADND